MDYINYKKNLKRLNLTSSNLMKLIDGNLYTPSSNWKPKNEVPKTIEIILELLNRLPENDRVLFIYEKLKESQEKQNP